MWKDSKKNTAYLNKVRKHYSMIVSKVSETDMIEHLDNHKPVNAYLKGLVRKDMEQTNTK